MQRIDSIIDIFENAVKDLKSIATKRDNSFERAESLESRVRDLSAHKIVLETKLYDAEERLAELENSYDNLKEQLKEAEARSSERSTMIDRLRNLIDPLRKAVTDMGI